MPTDTSHSVRPYSKHQGYIRKKTGITIPHLEAEAGTLVKKSKTQENREWWASEEAVVLFQVERCFFEITCEQNSVQN